METSARVILEGVSSKLERDEQGRLFAVVVVPRAPGESPGQRWRLLGNTFNSGRIGFLGTPTGRAPDLVEMRKQVAYERRGPNHQWPPELAEQARELHADGLSCPKVAAKMGVPFGTMKTWLWPPQRDRNRVNT
jgi:hypothetical protein